MHTPCLAFVIAALFAAPATAAGQGFTFRGVVTRDSTDVPVAGAVVDVLALGVQATTSTTGEFRLSGLRAGAWALAIRRPGYAPLSDSIRIGRDGDTSRTFVMRALPAVLDSVTASAPSPNRASPNLREFERRRQAGHGTYMDAANLRTVEERKLAEIMRRVSGTQVIAYRSGLYLATSRTPLTSGFGNAGGGVRSAGLPMPGFPRACWVQIYLDGVRIYAPGEGVPPDLSTFEGREFEALEFYRGPATTPPEFSAIGAACGTLVLWSRER